MTRIDPLDPPRGVQVSRVFFGVCLAAVGLIILVDRMGAIAIGPLWMWWPMQFVLFGLYRFLQPLEPGEERRGTWLILIGLWLQAIQLGLFHLTLQDSWPMLLIVLGLDTILRAGAAGHRRRRSASHGTEVRHDG